MSRLTFAVPPTADKGTFAAGWNARCAGYEYRHTATEDWQIGWKAADAVPTGEERRPYNDTAPLANGRLIGRAA